MLSGAGEKKAIDISEKIRKAVQNRKFKFKDITYRTTISMGVAEFSNERDKETLIGKSDQALYGRLRTACLKSAIHYDRAHLALRMLAELEATVLQR